MTAQERDVIAPLRAQNELQQLARRNRVAEVLRYISRGHNRVVRIARVTGWHERSVQRYVDSLISQGLVCWDTRDFTSARVLKLTPDGRSRLSA